MVNISFIGLDLFLVGELDKKYHQLICAQFGISSADLLVSSFDSFVYNEGHEQTSFNLLIRVECDRKFAQKEEKIAQTLLKISEEFSIHAQVYFIYFDGKSVYSRINPSYPRFIESSIEEEGEVPYDENQEIYTGNMFEKFDEEHLEDAAGSFESEVEETTSYNIFQNFKK